MSVSPETIPTQAVDASVPPIMSNKEASSVSEVSKSIQDDSLLTAVKKEAAAMVDSPATQEATGTKVEVADAQTIVDTVSDKKGEPLQVEALGLKAAETVPVDSIIAQEAPGPALQRAPTSELKVPASMDTSPKEVETKGLIVVPSQEDTKEVASAASPDSSTAGLREIGSQEDTFSTKETPKTQDEKVADSEEVVSSGFLSNNDEVDATAISETIPTATEIGGVEEPKQAAQAPWQESSSEIEEAVSEVEEKAEVKEEPNSEQQLSQVVVGVDDVKRTVNGFTDSHDDDLSSNQAEVLSSHPAIVEASLEQEPEVAIEPEMTFAAPSTPTMPAAKSQIPEEQIVPPIALDAPAQGTVTTDEETEGELADIQAQNDFLAALEAEKGAVPVAVGAIVADVKGEDTKTPVAEPEVAEVAAPEAVVEAIATPAEVEEATSVPVAAVEAPLKTPAAIEEVVVEAVPEASKVAPEVEEVTPGLEVVKSEISSGVPAPAEIAAEVAGEETPALAAIPSEESVAQAVEEAVEEPTQKKISVVEEGVPQVGERSVEAVLEASVVDVEEVKVEEALPEVPSEDRAIAEVEPPVEAVETRAEEVVGETQPAVPAEAAVIPEAEPPVALKEIEVKTVAEAEAPVESKETKVEAESQAQSTSEVEAVFEAGGQGVVEPEVTVEDIAVEAPTAETQVPIQVKQMEVQVAEVAAPPASKATKVEVTAEPQTAGVEAAPEVEAVVEAPSEVVIQVTAPAQANRSIPQPEAIQTSHSTSSTLSSVDSVFEPVTPSDLLGGLDHGQINEGRDTVTDDVEPKKSHLPSFTVTTIGGPEEEEAVEDEIEGKPPVSLVVTDDNGKVEDAVEDSSTTPSPRPWTPSYSVHSQGSPMQSPSFVATEVPEAPLGEETETQQTEELNPSHREDNTAVLEITKTSAESVIEEDPVADVTTTTVEGAVDELALSPADEVEDDIVPATESAAPAEELEGEAQAVAKDSILTPEPEPIIEEKVEETIIPTLEEPEISKDVEALPIVAPVPVVGSPSSWIPSYSVSRQGSPLPTSKELEVEASIPQVEDVAPVESITFVEEVTQDAAVEEPQAVAAALSPEIEEQHPTARSLPASSYSVTTQGAVSTEVTEPEPVQDAEVSQPAAETATPAPAEETKADDKSSKVVEEPAVPSEEKPVMEEVVANGTSAIDDVDDIQSPPSDVGVKSLISDTSASRRSRIESIASSRYFPGGWFGSAHKADEGRTSLETATGQFVASKAVSSSIETDSVSSPTATDNAALEQAAPPTHKRRWCTIM